MRIDGVIPHHVARAYGVVRPPAATPARVAAAANAPHEAGPTRLVAGAVVPGGTTGAEQAITTAPGSLALYTRAADRVEAAVALQLGRSIDMTG